MKIKPTMSALASILLSQFCLAIAYTAKLSANGNEIKFTREVGDFAKKEIVSKREELARLARVPAPSPYLQVEASSAQSPP